MWMWSEAMTEKRVAVKRNVLSANDRIAAENRGRLEGAGILVLNLISSPGSGKTSLLEVTIDHLKEMARLAVVAGDVQTRNDADRLERHGVPVQAIETGGGCHLDAKQVAGTVDALPLAEIDLLFIENVGNLVCPSSFDLGESMKVVLMSVTEGEDKPLKYPAAFRRSKVLVLTKLDLVPHLDFAPERAIENALAINPSLKTFATSSVTGQGLEEWTAWLLDRIRARERVVLG